MNALSFNYYICPEGVSLRDFVKIAAAAGAKAVGLTVRSLNENQPKDIRRLLEDSGLSVSSFNSIGYVLFGDPVKAAEQAHTNKRLITAAAELQAETLVLVVGGISHGNWRIEDARTRISDELAGLAEQAALEKVQLGLEPIHPLGIGDKGCVNTIDQALSLVNCYENVGLVIDLFHSWWDPSLYRVFNDALQKVRLVQICNVVDLTIPGEPQRDVLDVGVIDIPSTLKSIRGSGYVGYFEFEMFSHHLRARSVTSVVTDVARQYSMIADI